MSTSTNNSKISTYRLSGGIQIDQETRHEKAVTLTTDFPYRHNRYNPASMPGRIFPWHWHDEVECFYIRQGNLVYHLQGKEMVFGPGDVGFVNTGILHMTQPGNREACILQVHIFHPSLIHSNQQDSIAKRYTVPLTTNKGASIMYFPASSEEATAARSYMDEAYMAAQEEEAGWEFVIREAMTRLWLLLLRSMPPATDAQHPADSERLMTMLRFIIDHYDEPITLEEIAASAHISKKECERCFKRQINLLPFEHLTQYRLDTARRLLLETDQSVTDIALGCGFSSSSYFGKCFRSYYGISPSDYRKMREQAGSEQK